MTRSEFLRGASLLAVMGPLAACGASPMDQQDGAMQLAQAISALGPDVDPTEAERAATLSYSYGRKLAREYQISDPPLIHNFKVHQGTRPRGLCNHFTEDMLARLRSENFQTLSLHWATSPSTPFRIVHHSATISRKGAKMEEGIILDPWRYGGELAWAPVREDTRYKWQALEDVQDMLRARLERRR